MKKAGFLLIILGNILLSAGTAFGQMECRSMLGGHLTPFADSSSALWAIEGTMGPGIMTSPYDSLGNTQLNGGMLLGALDFTLGNPKHHFYVEGGFKNWKNSSLVPSEENGKGNGSSRHIGARQIFYSYTGDNTTIKLGLHESKLGSSFLVDERILGTSIDHTWRAFTFNFRAATVLRNFARMGSFCANRHLYGVLNPNYTENIGKHLGETNLTGLVINWNPSYTKPVESSSDTAASDEFSENDDEFSNADEFHEDHDFSNTPDNEFSSSQTKTSFVKLTNTALVLYSEYGSIIASPKIYTGVILDFDLQSGIFLQLGTVNQTMLNNNAQVYSIRLGKSIIWNNTAKTKISGAFIGKYNIDQDALFQPLFSNLFIGEIMRMDAVNFPLWQVALKHRFPGKYKIHTAVKAAGMIEGGEIQEQDIEAGAILFGHHLKLTLIGSRVETLLLPKTFYMGRLEVRLAF